MKKRSNLLVILLFLLSFPVGASFSFAEMTDLPVVKLQSLDKVTARTMTFEAAVGSTLKFGPLYIKIQACRKTPSIEKPESAAFVQIWEVTAKDKPQWIFSGWMFASSPALSSMDHPIYDVWVLDCLESRTAPQDDKEAGTEQEKTENKKTSSGKESPEN